MKRPSQFDVAKAAGVSRTTVSIVLNGVQNGNVFISDDTRKRVWNAIEELGYVPDARARALRSGDTKTLGLTILDIRNPHFWETAEGVEQEARAAGYHLLLSNVTLSYEFDDDIFTDLMHRRIDGLIIMGQLMVTTDKATAYIDRFFRRNLPIVELCDHISPHYHLDRVVCDYYAASKDAMDYLIGLSHRRIGLIYGVATPELGYDRMSAYKESLSAAGLPVEDELIVQCGPAIEDGYEAARALLALTDRPTAIVAINDLLAIGARRAIEDAGLRVPADVSLLGYDDIHISKYMVPRLTTVTKDITAMGSAAVRLLLSRIQEPECPFRTEHRPARLIVRESTGPAPV